MNWPLLETGALVLFLLVLARTTAFFAVFPVLGDATVPARIKAGAAAVVSVLVFGSLPPLAQIPASGLALGLMVAREALAGLLLGTVVRFVFMAAQFAGQAIGVQMGLAAASLFDPSTRETVTVSGRLYHLLAVLLFLGLDLHHPFLAGLGTSFEVLPAGGDILVGAGAVQWARLSGQVLLLALRLSLPVVGTLLVLDVALGFLARIVPQMNIFLVGFPLKIGVGIAALALGVGAGGRLLRDALERLVLDFHSVMSWMA